MGAEPPTPLLVPPTGRRRITREERDNQLISAPPSRKRSVSHRAIRKRAVRIAWAKRVLPLAALALLTCVVLWPEFRRITEASRQTLRGMRGAEPRSGQMTDARYRGVDDRGRPYVVTATAGQQVSAQQIDLADPKADMTLEGGEWVMLQAARGVFIQHQNLLDLAGGVTIYRDDGTFLHTSAATIDLRSGFAASSQVVSVEGPFGTLDATGFAVMDKGTEAQFTGPARLILNAKGSTP